MPEKFQIIAVCDEWEERVQEVARHFGCRGYTSLDLLLEESEAEWIVIATPTHLHARQTTATLHAGRHVLCEKPMAGNPDDALKMIEAAEKSGRFLSVFHNRRYAADFLKVREIIRSGCLGRILQIRMSMNSFGRRWDWQTLRKNGGGMLLNSGAHVLDQALQFLNGDMPDVYCAMQRALTLGDAEDHVNIVLRGKDSPLIKIELSSADAMGAARWKIYGTAGGLRGSDKALHWKYTDWSKMPKRQIEETAPENRRYNREDLVWVEKNWSADASAMSKESLFYQDFHRQLTQGQPPPVQAREAFRVVHLTERCFEYAAREAAPVLVAV